MIGWGKYIKKGRKQAYQK